MIERIDIETTPIMEECVGIEEVDYQRRATIEAETYRDQLLRAWHNSRMPRRTLPDGVSINIKRNPHDFGVWISLQIVYDAASNAQEIAAFWLENNQPEHWDHEAFTKLTSAGYYRSVRRSV